MEELVRILSPVYEITFKGKKYPVRRVLIQYTGTCYYATKELREALEANFGKYPFEAEMLDQSVDTYLDSREQLENLEEILYQMDKLDAS